jgi:hypothetical protein
VGHTGVHRGQGRPGWDAPVGCGMGSCQAGSGKCPRGQLGELNVEVVMTSKVSGFVGQQDLAFIGGQGTQHRDRQDNASGQARQRIRVGFLVDDDQRTGESRCPPAFA